MSFTFRDMVKIHRMWHQRYGWGKCCTCGRHHHDLQRIKHEFWVI